MPTDFTADAGRRTPKVTRNMTLTIALRQHQHDTRSIFGLQVGVVFFHGNILNG
jgi:hypothetical protein